MRLLTNLVVGHVNITLVETSSLCGVAVLQFFFGRLQIYRVESNRPSQSNHPPHRLSRRLTTFHICRRGGRAAVRPRPRGPRTPPGSWAASSLWLKLARPQDTTLLRYQNQSEFKLTSILGAFSDCCPVGAVFARFLSAYPPDERAKQCDCHKKQNLPHPLQAHRAFPYCRRMTDLVHFASAS